MNHETVSGLTCGISAHVRLFIGPTSPDHALQSRLTFLDSLVIEVSLRAYPLANKRNFEEEWVASTAECNGLAAH